MNIILPDFIKKCIKNLNNNGFSAFVVGGAIRDLIMNKTPHDFDIATNAPAQTVMKIFKNSIPTGLKHGTVTVIIDGNSIEITTFRTESNYFDNRHPEQIKFVDDICSDLSRRDFTVNAIAYNEKDGIIDEFGGIDDIKNKIIRTVGNPELRFKEDALRILRCFRFAAQLNFTIEQNKQKCAEILTDSLFNISYERIFIELKKTFISKNPSKLQSDSYKNVGW